jgi:hypothetical protein
VGEREDQPNQIVTGVLDVAERHEPLLDTPVPRTDDGTSLPLTMADPDHSGRGHSDGGSG